ncbi:MAG: hypothetical protein EZS28_032941, partial [Streblomastix strix]
MAEKKEKQAPVEDKPAKPLGILLLQIFGVIYILTGIALIVVSIIYLVKLREAASYGIVVLVFGLLLIVAAIFAFLGSRYDRNEKTSGECGALFCLGIFYFISLT